MCFSTLGIPERTYRTTISKVNKVGMMKGVKETEGKERKSALKKKYDIIKIEGHIHRYPRVESHYCRL